MGRIRESLLKSRQWVIGSNVRASIQTMDLKAGRAHLFAKSIYPFVVNVSGDAGPLSVHWPWPDPFNCKGKTLGPSPDTVHSLKTVKLG